MKFSKEKFLNHAPSCIKRQLKDHIDALDGSEVEFDTKHGKYGYIKRYFKNGQEHWLYPVYKEWCIDDSQKVAETEKNKK